MADTVVVLPGILGSEVWHLVRPGVRELSPVWLSYERLGRYGLRELSLDSSGNDPPPWTGRTEPGEPLPTYYRPLLDQLREDGWNVVNGSFDWRKDLRSIAAALRTKLVSDLPGANFHFVGHSLGGLVGRQLYHEFAAAGQGARFVRLVTLGSPHYGSYSAVLSLLRRGGIYEQIARWMVLRHVLGGSIAAVRPALEPAMISWRTIFQLLPFKDVAGLQGDPFRPTLYQSLTWAVETPLVTQAALDLAVSFQADFISIGPPGGQLVQVVGIGLPTAAALKTSNLSAKDLLRQEDGDGTVTRQLAELPAIPTYRAPSSHEALPRHPRVLADVSRLLREGMIGTVTVGGPVIF